MMLIQKTLIVPAIMFAGLLTTQLQAQLSESRLTEFTSDDTVFAVNINLDEIFTFIDKSREDYKYFTKSLEKEGGLDLTGIRSAFIALGKEVELVDEGSHFPTPDPFMAYVIRVKNPVKPQEIIDSWFKYSSEDYIEESLNKKPFYRYSDYSTNHSPPSVYFPDDSHVVIGFPDRIEGIAKGITDSGTIGADVVSNILPDEHVSFAVQLEGLSNAERRELVEDIGFSEMIPDEYLDHFVSAKGRIAIDSSVPALLKIEMSDEDKAEKLKSLINTGIMIGPGALQVQRDMMDESEFAEEEELEKFDSVFDLAEDILKHSTVSREGNVITFKVAKENGYPDVANQCVSLFAAQMRMVEKMIEDFELRAADLESGLEEEHDHDDDHDDDHSHDEEDDDDSDGVR